MTILSPLYERIRAHPVLGPALDAAPAPVRLHDDSVRMGTVGLWRLARLWRNTPGLPQESAAAFGAYDGGDVIDVGAFEGWYSALLAPRAKPGDRLMSLEPDPPAFATLLEMSAHLQRMFPEVRFVPLDAAAGDGRPVIVNHPPRGHPQFAATADGDGIATVPVDVLVAELGLRPSFVKVDVEGAESFVLEGMQKTLAENRPVLALELHHKWLPQGVSVESVEELVARHGYVKSVTESNETNEHQLWRPGQ